MSIIFVILEENNYFNENNPQFDYIDVLHMFDLSENVRSEYFFTYIYFLMVQSNIFIILLPFFINIKININLLS